MINMFIFTYIGLDIANIFLIYSNEVNLRNQLDLSDAKFVDIIHTSPIGLKGDYGHVDFYPDGGLHQRSCLTKGPVSNVSEIIIGIRNETYTYIYTGIHRL